jgi:hypothetical protein
MVTDRAKRLRTVVAKSCVAKFCVAKSCVAKSWVAKSCVGVFLVSTPLPGEANEIESPQFRKGLWNFQRTIERIRSPHPNQVLVREEMTRCVDPSLAMKAIFASPSIGNCTSARPELIDNRYVFPIRCDYLGPVRTEIAVESDVSYIEVNLLTVGSFPRKDVVVAQRVGDCDTAAGYRPSHTSDGFQLTSASSKKAR